MAGLLAFRQRRGLQLRDSAGIDYTIVIANEVKQA